MREGTDYDNEGGWFDANLVRFKAGRPQKIGGWQKDNFNTFLGTCRALHGWLTLTGTKLLGLGTNKKYYIEEGTTFNDVTPIRSTTGAGDVTFAKVGNGDATLTVRDTAHGAVAGDFVTYSGAASLGGNIVAAVLNQEYEIATIVNANSYTIEAKDTSGDTVLAAAGDSGDGGSSTVGAYQINTGLNVYVQSTGWGVGLWGDGTWGSSTALTLGNQLRLWSHDNFGEDLLINPRGGGVYYWDATNAVTTRAYDLATQSGSNLVPTVGLQVLVSETDRHVIVLGSDAIVGSSRTGSVDPMLIAFSDQENPLEFEPLTTNTAGSLRLSEGSQIIGGVKARQEVLIWTDTALYSMQFIGPPYTFGLDLINDSSGLISPKGAISSSSGVFWMGYDSFYVYNGAVQKIPCSVLSYVFDDFNTTQAFKVFAFNNSEFNEVGWYYPSASSDDIDRYVVYNYQQQLWYYGTLSRSAWLDQGIREYPVASGPNNYLYRHENGFDNGETDPASGITAYVESSQVDIGDGDNFAFIRRLIPDVTFRDSTASTPSLTMTLKTRNFPGGNYLQESDSSVSKTATVPVEQFTQDAHIRLRGRSFAFRIESENTGVSWRLGSPRIDIRPDGRR